MTHDMTSHFFELGLAPRTFLGEIRCRDKTVVPAANDNDVVRVLGRCNVRAGRRVVLALDPLLELHRKWEEW